MTHHKYIIVGAGPGGLQAGHFLHRRGRDYRILEWAGTPGSFFASQPRHRQLLSINKKHNFFSEDEFNWRHDWNSLLSDDPSLRFTRYSDDLYPHADDLLRYLGDYAHQLGLHIRYDTEVTRIAPWGDGGFQLSTAEGTSYTCEVLLMGLGAVAPQIPDDIEGIELVEGYEDHALDLERYRDKRVAILGQGNAAFETAEHLAGVAAFVHVLARSPIRFAWQTHFVGDVRAVNNNIFDLYQLKSLHAVLGPRVRRIRRLPGGTLQTEHEYAYPDASPPGTLMLTREYDHVIRCTGWRWVPDDLFEEPIRPATKRGGRHPALTPGWRSENVPNLYFVGGAMQGNDRRAASGFIHGYRYNIRTLARLLDRDHEDLPLPCTRFESFDWQAFESVLYERLSVSAALFQLFGVLCDALVVSKDGRAARYYQELPLEEVRHWELGDEHLLMFTLEFGFEKFEEPSISFMGPSDPTDTACAAFLHPVVRYRGEGEEGEFHFGDSLLGRWDRPHADGGAVMPYQRAFRRFVGERLGMALDEGPAADTGSYRVWTAEERERWRREQEEPEAAAPCRRPF